MTIPFNPIFHTPPQVPQLPPPQPPPLTELLKGVGMQNYQPPPQTPNNPSPKDMLLHALSMVTRPGSMALDAMREGAKRDNELFKRKYIKGEKLTREEESDLALSLVDAMPMAIAGTMGKAFNSVARNPGSADFLDNLYSRLSAAITSGPKKGQGQQWLRHLEKGATKGELDHTGLLEYLSANKDRVLGQDDIHKLSQINPVRLQETVYDNGGGMYGSYWPKLPDGVKEDPRTYKEIMLQGNLPYDARNARRGEETVAAARQALDDNRSEYEYLANLRDQAYSTGKDPSTVDAEIARVVGVRPALQAEYKNSIPLVEPAKHFEDDVTNQIGHLRTMLGERDGKISQILGELQSDTQQGARTAGRLGKAGEKLEAEDARLSERVIKAKNELEEYNKLRNTPEFTTDKSYELSKKAVAAEDALTNYRSGAGGVLPLPFQGDKEWAELLLKRALFEAAQNNADEIIIPSGRAVSEAVGLPAGGQKLYDKDSPAQLMEYIKKQLGVEVQPEQLFSKRSPTTRELSSAASPMRVGPTQIAIPDIPGPLPENYGLTLEGFLRSAFNPNQQLTEAKILSAIEGDRMSGYGSVGLNALAQDLPRMLSRLQKPPAFSGTAIPYPAEARNKVLTEGQRLWSALGLAGIPTADFFMQPKKEKKKEKK